MGLLEGIVGLIVIGAIIYIAFWFFFALAPIIVPLLVCIFIFFFILGLGALLFGFLERLMGGK